MIHKLKKGLSERKVKVFVLFLLASGLIWFLNNLSQTYIAKTSFDLDYVNSNENLKLVNALTDKVDVKLQTGGFKFLGYNFKKKSVTVDLAEVKKRGDDYYLTPDGYRGQIEKQLSSSMVLLEMDEDTLFFEVMELKSKEVPVESNIELNLAHNYLLEGKLIIEPSTVTLRGPSVEIDTIVSIRTARLDLPELTTDFSEKTDLYKPNDLEHTSFSTNSVLISGKVSKFSEKIINVPVEVTNLPSGMKVRTFPDEVSILCKAKIEELKNISDTDFSVIADYEQARSSQSNMLKLNLAKSPAKIFSASLMETKVEYILNKE